MAGRGGSLVCAASRVDAQTGTPEKDFDAGVLGVVCPVPQAYVAVTDLNHECFRDDLEPAECNGAGQK